MTNTPLTAENIRSLRAELARLENARPPTVTAFAEARVARIAEIKAALATVEIDPAPSNEQARREYLQVERALKNAGGGDKFGR